MKITPEHLGILRQALEEVEGASLAQYRRGGLTLKRWMWDWLHRARIDGEKASRWLYRQGYTDLHIETALRRIAKDE